MKPTPVLLTTDVVLFTQDENALEILLIKRLNPPFKDCWALPGGFVDQMEDLEPAAMRELEEETNVRVSNLFQVGAYGDPKRDERGRVVTVAFIGEVVKSRVSVKAADDAKEVGWFKVKNLPELAFDHDIIIHDALEKRNRAIL